MTKSYSTKRIIFIIILLTFSIFFTKQIFRINISLLDDDYNGKYIYVIDRKSQSKIISKNHKTKAYPASLNKIITTVIGIENIEDLSAIAPMDRNTYLKIVDNNSPMAGFYANEQTTYRDLLYRIILNSGGQAANSLSINISGSVKDFVKIMNNKASELGLHNTHFTNPKGPHDKKQYTTAYDMAILLDYVLDYVLDNGHFEVLFTKDSFHTPSTLDHPK